MMDYVGAQPNFYQVLNIVLFEIADYWYHCSFEVGLEKKSKISLLERRIGTFVVWILTYQMLFFKESKYSHFTNINPYNLTNKEA